jgi:hypothetical protein
MVGKKAHNSAPEYSNEKINICLHYYSEHFNIRGIRRASHLNLIFPLSFEERGIQGVR